jgi:DNA-binding XRE family transcriptional regulator
MLVVEKKRHIKVVINGTGTAAVIRILKEKLPAIEVQDEYVIIEDTAFWEKIKKYRTPGNALRVYRDNAGLTLAQLAEKTGIAKSHLSAMEHGKRSIGLISAKRIGKALNCDYRRLL